MLRIIFSQKSYWQLLLYFHSIDQYNQQDKNICRYFQLRDSYGKKRSTVNKLIEMLLKKFTFLRYNRADYH